MATKTPPPARIVTLVPAATEIVAALGLLDNLVARSHECDFPAEARCVPACTSARLDVGVSSGALDREVRALVSEALSVFQVDAAAIRALRPDVVVTQTLCTVCACSPEELEEALAEWCDTECRVISLDATSLDDVWDEIEDLGAALGAADAGRMVAATCRARMDRLAARVPLDGQRPGVAFLEWLDPIITAGHWTPELIEAAGGRCVLGAPGGKAELRSLDDLIAADPDVMILAPCGFDLPRVAQEIEVLIDQPGWRALRAVQTGRVYLADGNQYFNRPGPRLLDSAEILSEILHPTVFSPRRVNDGWMPLAA